MLSRRPISNANSLMKPTMGTFALNTMIPISMQPVQPTPQPIGNPQIGRGSLNVGTFEPPKQPTKVKHTKMANGLTKITEVKEKKAKNSDDVYDEEGNINWEVLEADRKYKPCERLLKKLGKGETKVQTVR